MVTRCKVSLQYSHGRFTIFMVRLLYLWKVYDGKFITFMLGLQYLW